MKQAPRKILIVKLSSLGDVVHAMPAVHDIRRAFPNAEIAWVVERAFAPLVTRCEGVHKVISCELRKWRKTPFGQKTRAEWRAFKLNLQAERYDAVIDLQGLSKSALLAWLAHTTPHGHRIAMANQTEGSGYEAPTRWAADVAIRLEPHVHAVQRARLVCAQALGYTLDGLPHFGLRPVKHVALPWDPTGGSGNSFVPRKAWVALVHGSSRPDKQWPIASWIALGQRLNHSGFAVALAHGNVAEKTVSETIAAQLDEAWVWPQLGLDTVTDAMAQCTGVIGVDSGLSHIAVALGLPHVQIYNFDTAWRTGPPEAEPKASPQVSVFASPTPGVEAVWRAWERLDTPVFCR